MNGRNNPVLRRKLARPPKDWRPGDDVFYYRKWWVGKRIKVYFDPLVGYREDEEGRKIGDPTAARIGKEYWFLWVNDLHKSRNQL